MVVIRNANVIVALFLSLIVCDVYARVAAAPVCNKNFTTAYYLIDVSDIAGASDFFLNMSKNYLDSLKEFHSRVGRRNDQVNYFDFPDLSLLSSNRELYDRVQENLPGYREDREQIFYRDGSQQNAGSYKFEVRRYNRKTSSLDNHPLFGRVKRKERPLLLEALQEFSDEPPEKIVKKLTVEHDQVVFQFVVYNFAYAEIVLDKFHLLNYGIPNTYALLKFEIFDDTDKDVRLLQVQKDELSDTFCNVFQGFGKQFSHIEDFAWFGYAGYYKLANQDLPSRKWFQEYPILFSLGQIVALSLLGFLILYLVLVRYKKPSRYRSITIKRLRVKDD